MSKTGVDAIDNSDEMLWQLDFARLEEPTAGSTVRTNDGKRLWFPVTVRDCTAKLTMYIQENAALKLSGMADADQSENVLRMRNCNSTSAEHPADQHERQVDVRNVDAAAQTLGDAPTEDSARLLSFFNVGISSTDIVLPAALHMLRK